MFCSWTFDHNLLMVDYHFWYYRVCIYKWLFVSAYIFFFCRYAYFIMRVTLAAIDHNFHLSRKEAQRKDGGQRGHRKYSKRSQKYHAEVVKEEKSYSYFPFLICKMLQRRAQMEGSFSQPSDRNDFDPKQIAPTLAMKEPPPTEVLMKGPSRFLKKPLKEGGRDDKEEL